MPKLKTISPKEQRFVEEFPIDFNGTQAVIRAGFKVKNENVAATYAGRLLGKVQIQSEIAKRIKQFSDRADTDLDRIFTEVKRLAFSDERKLFDENGEMLAPHKLDDNTAAAVASVEIEEYYEGKGEDRRLVRRKKVKFWDKNSALDKLSRYHALYKDLGTKENPLTVRLNWGSLSIDELARIRNNPELALAQRN